MSIRTTSPLMSLAALALTWLPAAQAYPDPSQLHLHGFIAQGVAASSHYDAIGNSTQGTADLHDAGFTASFTPHPKLLIAVQTLTRRFGDVDDGNLRLDFFSADFQAVSTLDHRLGIRGGRLKKPMGFFNESRDVIFTRPGILMPNAVYLEGQGVRDILFASEGGQLYGSHALAGVRVDWKLSAGLDSDADDIVTLFNGENRSLELTDYLAQQVMVDWGLSGLRTGITHFSLGLDGEFTSTFAEEALVSDSEFNYWVASLQWNSRVYSVTAEYGLRRDEFRLSTAGGVPLTESSSDAEGFYVQVDRRLQVPVTVFARFDWNVADRDDRDGSDYEAQSPATRHAHSRYARDHVLGLRWLPDANWGVFAEYHYYDGTLALGVNSDPDQRTWDMGLLSVAYKF